MLELIALRTREITPMVLFPFGTLLLIAFSRSVLFEGWTWSVWLVCTYLTIAVTCMVYALPLQKEASAARNQAFHDLYDLRAEKDYWDEENGINSYFDACITAAIDHVKTLNKGAFVPWFAHPLFQALLLPFTGTTGLLLLQSL
ncbi:MAG: hypothetical protein QGF90_19560 [Gammaproteobacteria bacterium]|nr:hypothetical protein [Gammaproteobacteria bacterium]